MTGKLLELRTEALAAIKRACTTYGTARANVANRWETLRAAGHVQLSSAPPEMASWLSTFNDVLVELKGPMKKDIANWTLSNARARTEHILRLISSLEHAATSINVHVTAAEERSKRQHKAELADLRRAQSERLRLLSPWRTACVPAEARVPACLLRHMLDNGLLVPKYGKRHNVRMVDCHDGGSDTLHEARPALLTFNSLGAGSDMARLASAIGERRIEENIAKAEAFLEHDTTRVSCDTRLVPLGGGQDHVEELAWVPQEWRKCSFTPEALRSLGTPWLLSHDIAAARHLPSHWPIPGVGHFLSVQR